ncbi:MAG: aminoacyl-tRNA hydrolase [Candidatus Moraniibacteriota bacterium]
MEIFLVAGLGNPEGKYNNTRHNIGFEMLDHLAETVFNAEFSFNAKINAFLCNCVEKNKKYILLKPATFMNNSGQAIGKIVNYYNIPIENILIIQDDIDIELGKIKVSQNSGPAGHKGIISVIENLGSRNFKRLRIGIRPEDQNVPTEKFVLQKFSKEEMEKIEDIKTKIPSLLKGIVQK